LEIEAFSDANEDEDDEDDEDYVSRPSLSRQSDTTV
jgi:hypothetical protein